MAKYKINYKKLAKPISYDSVKRKKKNVKYIVIHYTGNKGDKAKSNVDHFAKGNTKVAGAHFFIDRDGKIARSIPMNRTAWAVGGDHRNGQVGEATFYKICTNYNSVSIELCDIVDKKPSKEQIEATKWLVKYIKKYCKNANTIVRHWDVNGKDCPKRMIGKSNKEWTELIKQIVT